MNTPLRLTGVSVAATQHLDASAPARDTPVPARDAIDSWLSLLTSLLEIEQGERIAIRDELESHLRERVRDLTLAGAAEADATRTAIAELGDAAAFARRYQQAIGPSKRRLIMNVAALSLAGAAVLFSGLAVLNARPIAAPCPPGEGAPTPPLDGQWVRVNGSDKEVSWAVQRHATLDHGTGALPGMTELWVAAGAALAVPTSTFEPPADDAAQRLAELQLTLNGKNSWRDFFDFVGKSLNLRPVVDWDRFNKAQLQGDQQIPSVGPEATAADILARAAEDNHDPVAFRIRDDRIFFAPESAFDQQEQALVVYDLSPLVMRRMAMDPTVKSAETAEELTALIAQLVYPDFWVSNGGDRARVSRFDSKLFIQAPKRFHAKINWVMQQVLGGGERHGVRVPMPADAAPTPPVTETAAGGPPSGGLPLGAAPSATPGIAGGGMPGNPGTVFVDGTSRPGVFMLTPGLSLARVVTAAGGSSDPNATVVISRTENGKARTVHETSMESLLSGKGEDPTVQPGDRIIVRTTTNAAR